MRKLPFHPNIFRRVSTISWPQNAMFDKQARLMIPFLGISVFVSFVWLLRLTNAFQNPYLYTEFLSTIGLGGSFWLFVRLSKANKKLDMAQRKAKAAELRFDKIYQSGLIGLWFINDDGTVVQANDTFLDIIGYSQSDLTLGNLNRLQLTPDEYKELTAEKEIILKETGYCPPYEKEYFRKDGSRVNVMLGAASLPAGDIADFVAYAVDISNLKAAENREQLMAAQIMEKHQQMLEIFKNAPACIVIRKGEDLKIDFINDAALRNNRLSRHAVEGLSTAEYFRNVKTNFNEDILREVYRTGEPFTAKAYPLYYDRNGDGSVKAAWYDIVIVPTYDTIGQVDGIVTYTFDVSELVELNERLTASDQRFRFIADSIPHKLWTSGPDGKATYYNEGWYDYAGTDSFDELRKRVWEMIHPDDLDETKKMWQQAIENGLDLELEHRLKRYDGQFFWHLSRVCVFKDEQKKPLLWVGTSTNIHSQKIAHEKIIAREQQFKILANNNSSLIWQSNANGKTIFVNQTWRDYTGIIDHETTIQHWLTNVHEEDRQMAHNDFKLANAVKSSYESKYRFLDKRSGNYRWMLDKAEPVWQPEFDGYIGVMTDITDQELARQAVEELAAKKDEFFSIASHELKTPITTLKASLQIIERMLSNGHPIDQTAAFVKRANKQATKLTGIVNDLLDVNKIQFGSLEINRSLFLMNELIAECVEEMSIKVSSADIRFVSCGELLISADPARIEQVIINLLDNALKYSPDNQLVTIITEKLNDSVKVSVLDNGIGIPEDKMDRVFDRFFRVHDNSKHYSGLGLGLFISGEIIRRHGGDIGLESQLNLGTTFWFTLPQFVAVN